MMVDVVIPTREAANPKLLETLTLQGWVNNIIVTKTRPLSVARREALLGASTELVAMFDDDVSVPADWFDRLSAFFGGDVGAVASVALQSNTHRAAYEKVVNLVFWLHELDTSPHINNVLVRRSLFRSYDPPLLFFGEDHFFKRHVETLGYKWRVVPFIGVVHSGSSKNLVSVGVAYRRYGHYTVLKLARRFLARMLLAPFAAVINANPKTLLYLWRDNAEFFAGWLKEAANGVD